MDCRWLACVGQIFTGKFVTKTKCQQARTNTQWNDDCKATLNSRNPNVIKKAARQVFTDNYNRKALGMIFSVSLKVV